MVSFAPSFVGFLKNLTALITAPINSVADAQYKAPLPISGDLKAHLSTATEFFSAMHGSFHRA
jgi:hypothetical protein